MAASNSRWVNKIDNLVHNYPKLPDFPLGNESLPFQIGKNVSVKEYNTFLERHESTGYKFYWKNKNVYIIEMANQDHEAVISYLQDCFKEPNNRVKIHPPIEVYGQPYHFKPMGSGEKMAPDIAVCPSEAHVLRPLIPHPGPPPSTTNRRNHARIFCEVANAQKVSLWETTCETWMHEKYVRCVFGVKLDDTTTSQVHAHRGMIAKLWSRRTLAGSVLSTNPTLAGAGVHIKTWDFGTVQFNTQTPTGCNRVNLPAYRVTIPISDVFWDPPIVHGNVNETGYTPTVPTGVVGTDFVIDLYGIQQWVL
ncbi:1417_t:CDS:2, partial [Diversispora eburnea]